MSAKVKVLIADDSKILRERVIDMLSEFGGVEIIGETKDSEGTIESVQGLKPNVVILDIRMPGEGGIEVLKAIKKYKPAPIVIIFTNYPYRQYRKKCLEAGADFFFDKSSEFEKVTQVLSQMVQGASH